MTLNDKQNSPFASPSIGGGYQTLIPTKSTKGEDIWYKIKLGCSVLIKKISSHLSVDYYKSNNENQFKDIQLQLHATDPDPDPGPEPDVHDNLRTRVSNPYTFSIQGNKSFRGVCEVDKPTYTLKAQLIQYVATGGGFIFIGYLPGNSNTTISPDSFKNVTILRVHSLYRETVGSGYQESVIQLSKKIADTITLEMVDSGDIYTFTAATHSVNRDDDINSPWNYGTSDEGPRFYENETYKFYLY